MKNIGAAMRAHVFFAAKNTHCSLLRIFSPKTDPRVRYSRPSPWVSKLTKYFENFAWGWGEKKLVREACVWVGKTHTCASLHLGAVR